jgi:hypothetical protein
MSNYFCTFVCNYKTIEIFNSIPVISFYNLEVWVKYIIWLFLSCNHLHKSCPGSFTKKTGNYNIYKLIILLKVASALNTITLTYDTIYKQYMGGGSYTHSSIIHNILCTWISWKQKWHHCSDEPYLSLLTHIDAMTIWMTIIE